MSAARLEALRAARLHRQRRAPDVDTLVRETIGLHSTDYATPYLSAWARLDRFDPAALYARLNAGRGLVRVNAFRNTVHVVHVEDAPVVLAACGAAVAQVGRRSPGLKALPDAAIDRGVDALVAALADGPRTTNQLKAALPELAADLRYWTILAMGRGEVVRADGPAIRSNRTRYALARQWIPGFVPGEIPAADARRAVLARAVRSFGPLTEADLAWWLPAPKGEVARALAGLGRDYARVVVDGVAWWYAAELADAPSPPREAQGAWLLPYEDALLKGYQDRAWLLAPGLQEVVFPHNVTHWHPPDGVDPGPGPHPGARASGEARPTVWYGGRVVGRWEERDGDVVLQLHADIGAEGAAAVEAERRRLAAFVAATFA